MKFDREYFDAGLNRLGTRCEKWDEARKDHGEDILMEQGLTHAAEENGFHGSGHSLQHMAVCFQGKIADGLIKPGMAEAHFAV